MNKTGLGEVAETIEQDVTEAAQEVETEMATGLEEAATEVETAGVAVAAEMDQEIAQVAEPEPAIETIPAPPVIPVSIDPIPAEPTFRTPPRLIQDRDVLPAPPEYADLADTALLGMFPEELGLVTLYDPSPIRRINAVQMLRGRGDIATPMLINVAEKTPNDTAIPAAMALADLGSEQGAAVLTRLLSDVNTPLDLRIACAEGLAKMGDPNRLTVLNLVRESNIPDALKDALDEAIETLNQI